MFSLEKSTFGQFQQVILEDPNGANRLQIVPAFGANLLALSLSHQGQTYPIIDAATKAEALKTTHRFNSAWLFPFPNRLQGGTYQYQGRSYQFPCNEAARNNALHGNIFDKSFRLVGQNLQADSGEIVLQHRPATTEKIAYPFDYQLDIIFRLSLYEGLTCQIRVQNLDTKPMPFGLGWHPYFRLAANIDLLELQLPKCQILELDAQLIPNAKRKVYPKAKSLQSIENQAFDNLFQLDLETYTDKVSSLLYDSAAQMGIEVWQETGAQGFNYLQVFTPPHRNSIAIEPMTCPANALNSGEGLIWLEPQNHWQKQIGVKLISK